MNRIPEKPKRNWLARMLCCTSAPDPVVELKRPKKKSVAVRKKNRIQLALIGSTSLFALCKMTRKNIAIDGYKFKGTLPNPVNRYLSERIRGDVGLFRGEMSSILWRGITYPTRIIASKEEYRPNVTCETLLGGANCFNKGVVDYYVYCPRAESIPYLLSHNTNKELPLYAELQELCQRCSWVVLLLPAETILDQLGMVLPYLPNKEIELESIVISGNCVLQVVYIGDVRIREEEKVDFLVKELLVGSEIQEGSVRELINMLLRRTEIRDIVKMLVNSIGDATTDPLLTCFLRNTIIREWASETELEKLFKPSQFQLAISHTPNLARTGSFGQLTSKLSIRDEGLLNKGDIDKHSFEVESEDYEEFTLKLESEFEE
ncbi:unnamed protein product [Sphagnum balticum]